MSVCFNALCVTYPCPESELNLKVIQTLKKKFKCDVGYRDESAVSPSILAWHQEQL